MIGRLVIILGILAQIGLPFPGPGGVAVSSPTVTLVQSKGGSFNLSGSNASITPTSNVTSGDFLVVVCMQWAASTNTPIMADTLANTWTTQGNTGNNTSDFQSRAWIFTATASSTGTDTNVTCQMGVNAHSDVAFAEYSGATAVDATAIDCNNNSSATTGVSHSVTTTVQDTLVTFSFAADSGGTLTTPSGFATEVTGAGTSGNIFKLYDKSAVAAGAQSVSNVGSGTHPMHSCLLPIH